ncbi:MAG: type II toxin-antitoxin system VapC family toxin, partial [Syntrophobacteraceae bacterium]|nr:type II toxin-antitoxin system VapC family toxin [Syntrophobacteraceae bacterium]
MIFVDSNVFIYAVGRPHPLRAEAQEFFISSRAQGKKLVTSAEVLQELLHAYLPVARTATLDAALTL